MSDQIRPRVMWLLNHGAARRFETAMLKQLGIHEIFLPKSFPNDPSFRSASVDYSEDKFLTIPKEDLEKLNAADWYTDPGRTIWDIANRYFDVVFFGLHDGALLKGIARHFRGTALLRAYGMPRDQSYSILLRTISRLEGESLVHSLGKRFYFAEAYAHLHENEAEFLRERRLFLPLGLDDCRINDHWRGNDPRLFFVCPDIGFNEYYRQTYQQFIQDFKGIPYAIGGAQPVRIGDPHVLGFLPQELHEQNMREMRVMFYHSTEPNHIHYHPFEAVRAGMPLVFMAGGMLDRLGGERLPGRCTSIKEARRKISAILGGDRSLIDAIRNSQPLLLDSMRPENLIDRWRGGIDLVCKTAYAARVQRCRPPKPARIAVIVPVGYRGGSLRAAKLVAEAIDLGARQDGTPVEVVFGHLDDPECYPEEEFKDLPQNIVRRPYKWKTFTHEDATSALHYSGRPRPLIARAYQVPDDGIQQFNDCDLWLIVSDRLELPLLPLRPYAMIVYDYLQRYLPLMAASDNWKFLQAAHGAERVFVTTDFTYGDALQFAGLEKNRIVRLPMLAPDFSCDAAVAQPIKGPDYFLWTTNLAPHKNHVNAIKALQIYYERLGGRLTCCVTGVGTGQLLKGGMPHLTPLSGMVAKSPELKSRLRVLGELPDTAYRTRLAGARFLWHAGWIDNGTFSVIEAAHFGVPALSSAYPAMREIDNQYQLGLSWMDAHNPDDMARQLKYMESAADTHRQTLPTREQLLSQRVENLARPYWEAVSDCL
ncbi:glycosyltransferase [Herbaspirillum sp. HC18]|nr:glycosyltransferase [Herbaspirillum sp. HC18]